MKRICMCCMILMLLLSLTVGTTFAAEEAELEKDLIDFSDFNSEEVGSLAVTGFGADWSLANPAGDAPELVEENGNRFARIKGYSQVVSPCVMEDGEMYEFSVKLRQSDFQYQASFVFRATAPVLRSNSKAAGATVENPAKMNIEFYESDWYIAFFGKGQEHMGGSGIGIMLKEDAIRVYFRTHIDGALRLGVAYHDFAYPEGATPGEFITFTIIDNGSDKIEIYVGETLLTVITFSNADYYEDDEEDINDYYKTATMSDSAGNALDLYDSEGNKIEAENNTITNAMISAMSSYTGFGTRMGILDIDDISVSYLKEKSTATETPAVTPGNSSEVPADTTATPSDTTKAPEATKTSGIAATEAPAADDSSSSGLVIGITVGCIVIVAAVIVYMFVLKKKNK